MAPENAVLGRLTPLQRAIYETDQLGINLRDSMRMVTAQVGFFVGQERYLTERRRIQRILDEFGPAALEGPSPSEHPRSTGHQIGSAS